MSHTGNSTAPEHPFRVLAIFPHPSLKNCFYASTTQSNRTRIRFLYFLYIKVGWVLFGHLPDLPICRHGFVSITYVQVPSP